MKLHRLMHESISPKGATRFYTIEGIQPAFGFDTNARGLIHEAYLQVFS
jgi:hypothetical protein